MTISERILAIDWSKYDSAYGNVAEDIPDYLSDGYIPNVPKSLLNLFSDDKETALQASHDLWCCLCHQYSFVSSAALPAYDILFYGLQNLEDDLKVEILDIIRGFVYCISKNTSKTSWQGQLREKMEKDKSYYEMLMSHPNEDIAEFAKDMMEEW